MCKRPYLVWQPGSTSPWHTSPCCLYIHCAASNMLSSPFKTIQYIIIYVQYVLLFTANSIILCCNNLLRIYKNHPLMTTHLRSILEKLRVQYELNNVYIILKKLPAVYITSVALVLFSVIGRGQNRPFWTQILNSITPQRHFPISKGLYKHCHSTLLGIQTN